MTSNEVQACNNCNLYGSLNRVPVEHRRNGSNGFIFLCNRCLARPSGAWRLRYRETAA